MYAILAVAWVVLGVTKEHRLTLLKITIVASFIICGVLIVAAHFYFPNVFTRFFFMFFSGAAFYVLRDYIRLHHSIFWLFVVVLILSALVNTHAFLFVYILTVAYILFYIAYVPSGYIRKYNLVGDYSYGIYIFAFPVQQSIAALIPGVSVLSMLLISAPVTLLLAALSWHLLERRALGLKKLYVGHTQRMFSYRLNDRTN